MTRLLSLTFFALLFFTKNYAQLTVTITGTFGCVPLGVPVSYTGTNAQPIPTGCTWHVWQATNGNFFIGTTNIGATLCITETINCSSAPSTLCNNLNTLRTFSSSSSNPTSTVSVTWNTGITDGIIQLSVFEQGNGTSGSKGMGVDPIGFVTDIVQTAGTCNSGTYSAVLSCTAGNVEWYFGTSTTPFFVGNPVTINQTGFQSGTFNLRARVVSNNDASNIYSEQFRTSRPVIIAGPPNVNENTLHTYPIDGGVGVTVSSWFVQPVIGVIDYVYTPNYKIDVKFNTVNVNTGGVIIATGASTYCGNWTLQKFVNVLNVNNANPTKGEADTDIYDGGQHGPSTLDGSMAARENASSSLWETDVSEAVSVFPNPVKHGETLAIDASMFPGAETIELLDMSGRVVHSFRGNGEQIGKAIIQVPNEVVAGIYTLCIVGDGAVLHTEKIVVND